MTNLVVLLIYSQIVVPQMRKQRHALRLKIRGLDRLEPFDDYQQRLLYQEDCVQIRYIFRYAIHKSKDYITRI